MPSVGDDGPLLENLTEVIVRQTNDLRRIVNEFSKFARMPEPETAMNDLTKLVADAVLLQEGAMEGVALTSELPEQPVVADLDSTMIGQALTNLIKNAGEAIESLEEKKGFPEGYAPRVHVEMSVTDGMAHVTISDNGIGLPEDRSRLFEPYVTTREKGTGLGLPIVKKIIEEHGGSLALVDASPLDQSGHIGAAAKVVLPISATQEQAGDLAVAE